VLKISTVLAVVIFGTEAGILHLPSAILPSSENATDF